MIFSEECTRRNLGRLSLLVGFPRKDPHALAAVVEIFGKYCKSDTKFDQAVNDILQSWDDWHGPASLRGKLYELTQF